MKKIILFLFVFASVAYQANAQNSIHLNIHHKLSDTEFEMDQAAKNNLEHDFKLNRLEYYISEITLIHDGGTETLIEDLWVLADASTLTEVDLGLHDVSTLEKILLHVGVDPDHNHLDPSSYQGTHPLAPKFPSMHWGWTAGYRFVALEGKGGTNLDQVIELHGLGDTNYLTTEIELDITAEDNSIVINLDADYTKALENIEVNNGVIVHGDNFQAKQCLENFRDYVFSPSGTISSTNEFIDSHQFEIYPNPITDGLTTLKLDSKASGSYDVSIISLDGKQVNYLSAVSTGQTIDFSAQAPGIYFMNLIKDGITIHSNKVVVK